MEKKEIAPTPKTVQRLDDYKQTTKGGTEYWFARDIQALMGYADWDNFQFSIEKAKLSCESVGANPSQHFGDTTKMLALGNGAKRRVKDIALTRYGCYLVAMNGDPSKPEIAASQTYFASQTRKQELSELAEQQHVRVALRDRVRIANKELNGAAKEAGVQNYAFFHDAGYMGLYGGLRLSEIKALKRIDRKDDLLDHAGRAELAANEFRITQTELQLRRQPIQGQKQAEDLHNHVGKEVRQTMAKLSGTMPENLPTEASIKKLKGNKPKLLQPPE